MPNRFQNVQGSGNPAFDAGVNRNFAVMDGESLTKKFNGPNGTSSIIQGRLPNGRYGQVYYDENGVARILIGQAPDDGRMGIWISSDGEDVLELLA